MGKWYRNRDELARRFADAGYSWTKLARSTGVATTTLKSAGADLGITAGKAGMREEAGFTQQGDSAVFVSEAQRGLQPKDVDALLRERNIDLGEWEVERVVLNEWESMQSTDDGPVVVPLRQIKAFLKRRVPFEWLFPAVEVKQRKVPQRPWKPDEPRVVWVAGDQQCPYHDPDLHDSVCRWLKDVKPHLGILIGDTLDFPTISRHGDNPNWSAPVQTCLNTGYRVLSEYRDASPDTILKKLRGNHDYRLESELLSRAERVYGIRPADLPGEPQGPHALSLRRLLHLDALHISLEGQEGDHWKFGEVRIDTRLVARHAPPPRSGSRNKADMVFGHDHRQYLRSVTEWDDGDPVVRTEMGVGTLARLRGGLGYADDPDWQQGFGTVTVYPDGHRHFELAAFRHGRLHWRGETW